MEDRLFDEADIDEKEAKITEDFKKFADDVRLL
jgi:hypothetical protein